MPDPITIPSQFGEGTPLSARLLNGLQEEILRQLYAHTHTGGTEGPQLQTGGYSDGSVTEPKLADGAVTARTLGAAAVGPGNLAPGAVTQGAIAAGAVGNAQIVDDAVSEGKLDANVRLKLNRIGGGISSASSVLWRDPQDVFKGVDASPSVVETLYQPREVFWNPAMTGLNDNNEPFRLNPRVNVVEGKEVLDSFDVFRGDALKQQEPLVARIVEDSVRIATQEIGVVGAFQLRNTGSTQPVAILSTADTTRTASAFVSGAAGTAAFATGDLSGLAARAGIAARTGGFGAEAESAEESASVSESSISGASGLGFSAGSGASALALTQNGERAAVRMTTVGVVDEKGAPVAPGTEGSYTVTSGFSGKQDFLGDGPDVDYRSVGNDADRKRAAKGASETLYNLGLDNEYLTESGAVDKLDTRDLDAYRDLLRGDEKFFLADTQLRGTSSWLADLLNNPELFGSGYAISGGRNILSVTRFSGPRQSVQGEPTSRAGVDEWVRVRFITHYLNSSYAVSVTPRASDGKVIVAQIRAKTPQYCDIRFTVLSAGGGLLQTNKVSFDLAVFGDLTTAE